MIIIIIIDYYSCNVGVKQSYTSEFGNGLNPTYKTGDDGGMDGSLFYHH